jgi:predicted porin
MYEQGPIYATLAYQTVKAGDNGTGNLGADRLFFDLGLPVAADDELTAFKVGGSYSMNQFAVNAVIEKTTFTPAAGGGDQTGTNLYLGGKFNVNSTDAAKLAYAKHGQTTGNNDGASAFSIGYDHGMSKSTTVYALYTKVTNDAGGTSKTATAGADPSTLSAGIKYAF